MRSSPDVMESLDIRLLSTDIRPMLRRILPVGEVGICVVVAGAEDGGGGINWN